MKLELGLLLASLITSPFWGVTTDYSENFTVEDHVLVSVEEENHPYLRIYAYREVTTIAEHAFDDCHFVTMMISTTVTEINATFPTELTTIEFTGSREDISFAIPEGITVVEYADDEGFINYWKEYIRPNINGSICNVKKEHYLKMKSLYKNLEHSFITKDLNIVNSTDDGTGTIKDSIAYLDSYFGTSNKSQMTEKEISQSVMITMILIIASFGMTSIGLFYFLKDRKVIE